MTITDYPMIINQVAICIFNGNMNRYNSTDREPDNDYPAKQSFHNYIHVHVL